MFHTILYIPGSRKIGRSPAADWAPRPSVCRAPDVKKIRCRGRQRISSAARLDRLPTLTWPICLLITLFFNLLYYLLLIFFYKFIFLITSQTRYYNRVLNITGLFVRGTRKSSKIRKVNIQLVMPKGMEIDVVAINSVPDIGPIGYPITKILEAGNHWFYQKLLFENQCKLNRVIKTKKKLTEVIIFLFFRINIWLAYLS